MNEDQIRLDRKTRVDSCKSEIEEVLGKYEMALTAEDFLTPNVKVNVQIQFMDIKKYPDAEVAQPETTPTDVTIGADTAIPEEITNAVKSE